ncbi:MAG TPA: SgcJ/EcaC family oxidoreductase, partial [Pyrinomonadaceae bacterium]|nr:SgcJ/EcaC family oxidoreductase [Pyrinomonadaceae bacterium]
TENENDKKIARRVGGSAAFRNFIRDELMPQIKARYRTTAETAIVGESLAGLFVVETFLLEPDLFDTYIAFDPSLWWNNQKLVNEAGGRLRARPKLAKTLYFANSGEEAVAGVAQRFAEILGKNAPAGIRWHFEKMPDEKHSTVYHPAALKAFRAVFKPAAAASDSSALSQSSADSMPDAAPQASDSEMTKVRRAIDAGNAVWAAAWAKGDASIIPGTFTPDGKEFVAGGRIYKGRKEILALMRDLMRKRGGKAKLTVTTTDVWLDGDTAYETGTAVYEFTVDGQPQILERRYFTVWKRQSKRGAWKIYLNTGVAKQ